MLRRSTLTTALLIAIALVLSAVAFAATQNVTQTARSGGVTASFSFTAKTAKNALTTYTNEMLAISRGSQNFAMPLKSANCPECAPSDPTRGGHSIQLADLGNTGDPNVLLTLYSGGAHCCTVLELFTYSSGTGAYVETDHNFADPAYKLETISGNERFLSANAAFEYEFTDYADSGRPIQIWAFENGAFTDVTRSYPALIAKDAALWAKAYKSSRSNIGGFLAAWAADEELLGNNALVESTLQSELKAGALKGNLAVNGKRYITLLNRFLKKTGYTH